VDFSPVPPAGRIPTLDVLRGFALFGVLWSNLNALYAPTVPSTVLDRGLELTQSWLILGRPYAILAFLFGIGFALQLGQADDRNRDAHGTFYRRMLVLLLIGVVHGVFIWHADILTQYALLGFLLIPFHRLPPRRLLIAAVVILLGVPYLTVRILNFLHAVPIPFSTATREWLYAHGTYLQVLPERMQQYFSYYQWLGVSFAQFLALFLLGLWVARRGIVSRLPAHLPWLRRVLWVGLGCFIIGSFLRYRFDEWWPPHASPIAGWRDPAFWSPRHVIRDLLGNHLWIFGSAAMYVAALTLLVQRTWWRARLAPLAALGRMTLTTYLTQSVVCTLLFYGYGLGWYGQVGYTGMLAITLVLFGAQLVFSVWWLHRYRFGPAEWLWRSLTYRRRQPMRLS
jgi:uncharacterized protein